MNFISVLFSLCLAFCISDHHITESYKVLIWGFVSRGNAFFRKCPFKASLSLIRVERSPNPNQAPWGQCGSVAFVVILQIQREQISAGVISCCPRQLLLQGFMFPTASDALLPLLPQAAAPTPAKGSCSPVPGEFCCCFIPSPTCLTGVVSQLANARKIL